MAKRSAKSASRKKATRKKATKKSTARKSVSQSKKPTKKSASKKPARKGASRTSSPSSRSPSKRSTRSSRASRSRHVGKTHSFVPTYLWLVIIDGFLSLISIAGHTLFGESDGLTAVQTVSGLYGFFVLIISILALFVFWRSMQDRSILWVPLYVMAAPLIIWLASLLLGEAPVIGLVWALVIGEIILATWQLNKRQPAW